MDLLVQPARLRGTVCAPASKSFVHRYLIAAALSDAPTTILFEGASQDIAATAECLAAMCGGCTPVPGGLQVRPLPAALPAGVTLDAGESGSTARFLLPVAAAAAAARGQAAAFTLTGRGRLPGRPMQALCAALRGGGCSLSADALPLQVGGHLKAGRYTLPGDVSSQFITGLLLALPLLAGESCLRIEGPLASAGYIDITLEVLARFGVRVQRTAAGWHIPGGQRYRSPGVLRAEGDWSGGAFWLTAAWLQRRRGAGGLYVTGLQPHSAQGDRAVGAALAALASAGARTLHMDAIPDLLPVLAVAAAARQGRTVFADAARLRLKESDRLQSTCALLRALGGQAATGADWLAVQGTGALAGGAVQGAGDHRIVMAAAVAALICRRPVHIAGAETVQKSYPRFFEEWRRLGGVWRRA